MAKRSNKPTKYRNKWRIRWTDAQGKRRSETWQKHADAELAKIRYETEAEEIRRRPIANRELRLVLGAAHRP